MGRERATLRDYETLWGYAEFARFSESSVAARADLKLGEALRVSFPVPCMS